jgi:class 3 adenylate cyclase
MRTKKRLHPYVTPELAQRLESYCAARGITLSAFVEAAAEDRLKGEPKDLEVVLRRLDRQDRAAAARQREQTILMESFAAFVRIWLAHHPPLADADKPAAERLSASRYQKFIDYVCRQLAGGAGFGAEVAMGRVGTADSGTTAAPKPLAGSENAQP